MRLALTSRVYDMVSESPMQPASSLSQRFGADIHLKREALSRLEMPVVVKYGHIGRLDIAVPYVTLLAGSPIQVSIEEMFLVVGPLVSRGNDFDPKEYRMLMRAAKQAANEENYREEERKELNRLENYFNTLMAEREAALAEERKKAEERARQQAQVCKSRNMPTRINAAPSFSFS